MEVKRRKKWSMKWKRREEKFYAVGKRNGEGDAKTEGGE